MSLGSVPPYSSHQPADEQKLSAVDSSMRHVPKLDEVPDDSEPVYCCQLCGRHGLREQLADEECPLRSGVIRRRAAMMGSAPTKY